MVMLDLLIVTGASKGIGSCIVDECASISKQLLLLSSTDTIHKKAQSTERASSCRVDLAQYTEVRDILIPELKLDKPMVIGIVLSAARLGEPGGLLDSQLEDWDLSFRTNVLGNLEVIKTVCEVMYSGSELRIVAFAGGGAAYGYPDFSGYALTKTAIVRAVENLDLEFKKKSINASVIALAPGAVATDILAKVLENGGVVKTRTHIKEPAEFVRRFLNHDLPIKKLSGRFIHVRDSVNSNQLEGISDSYLKLRRVE